jgi:hypothetical protein
MALKDWVRNDGYIESLPAPSPPVYVNDETFIMLVRDIQFQDVKTGGYNNFPTLYDVALANKGKNYIPVTDNTKLIQDPPNIGVINSYRKK